MPPVTKEHALIPTTEFIKNLNVVYEEVLDQVEPEQFVIREETPQVAHEIVEIEEEEDQFLLDFDMPISGKTEDLATTETVVHSLEDIEVNDPVNVIPVTEVNEDGITKYSLDDYMEIEEQLNTATPVARSENLEQQVAEDEIELITKEQPVSEVQQEVTTDEEIDITELPINEVMKLRAEERKRKMHAYNYKFKNSHRLEEIEKKPAFQRQGVELDELPTDSDRSRTTVNIDENDDIQLRGNNNSFLHDNVD